MADIKKEIYIIRHGETDFNKSGIVQGSGIDSDLNETGRNQAKAFYNNYAHLPFEKIYVTALKRTNQTVDLFLKQNIECEIMPEFNEISWGVNEGKGFNEDTQLNYNWLIKEWNSGNTHLAAENGESPDFVLNRQKMGLQKILKNKNEKLILLVMHGRAMRILLSYMSNKPLSEMDSFPHQNTCLYKVEYDYNTNEFNILMQNNIDHLVYLN